jgi:hypothetical protein
MKLLAFLFVLVIAQLKFIYTGSPMDFRLVYMLLLTTSFILEELKLERIKPFCGNQSLECQKVELAIKLRSEMKIASILMLATLLIFPAGDLWWFLFIYLNIHAWLLLPGNVSMKTITFYQTAGKKPGEITTYELPHWHALKKELQKHLLEAQFAQPPVLGRPHLVVIRKFTRTICVVYRIGEKDRIYCPENNSVDTLLPIIEPFKKKEETAGEKYLDIRLLNRGE